MTSHIDTDTLRETLAAVTPGPWFVAPNGTAIHDKRVWLDESGARFGETPNIAIDCGGEANARLIAMAPGLASETLRLRERVEALEGALRAVIDATRAYLPPDGIDARECINRILTATDNSQIIATMGGGNARA